MCFAMPRLLRVLRSGAILTQVREFSTFFVRLGRATPACPFREVGMLFLRWGTLRMGLWPGGPPSPNSPRAATRGDDRVAFAAPYYRRIAAAQVPHVLPVDHMPVSRASACSGLQGMGYLLGAGRFG